MAYPKPEGFDAAPDDFQILNMATGRRANTHGTATSAYRPGEPMCGPSDQMDAEDQAEYED